MKRIVIIGSGAAGVATVIQCLKVLDHPASVVLIGEAERPGTGIAYRTTCERHLLNVRAAGMSLFPEVPEHFSAWLARHRGLSVTDAGPVFAERREFSAYLSECLEDAIRDRHHHVEFVLRQSRATLVEKRGTSYVVGTSSGDKIDADIVVLATGNLPPKLPAPLSSLVGEDALIANPWMPNAWDRVCERDSVLCIGTGLTMIDVLLELRARGLEGKVTAVSRRGLLPHKHEAVSPKQIEVPEFESAAELLHFVSGHCREQDSSGNDWRSVIDGLRPHNARLWKGLSDREKRRFANKLQTFWDVHRHRVAPGIHSFVQTEVESGSLRIVAGHLCSATRSGTQLEVELAGREAKRRTIAADVIVNCTGPSQSWKAAGDPLFDSLTGEDIVQYDSLGWGVAIDDQHKAGENVFALGPICRGTLWETTAMPEIRVQAATVAREIACIGA